jgi:hypothetical protein
MLDDVKSWNGKKGFVTEKHTIIMKAYRCKNDKQFYYIDV